MFLQKNILVTTTCNTFRKLGVQEDELKRAVERAELAESKLKNIEDELQTVGENMKQLEMSGKENVGS